MSAVNRLVLIRLYLSIQLVLIFQQILNVGGRQIILSGRPSNTTQSAGRTHASAQPSNTSQCVIVQNPSEGNL